MFQGGDIEVASNWLDCSGNVATALPGPGDVGVIAVNGVVTSNLNGNFQGATINHTGGTLTGTFNANSAGLPRRKAC